MGNADQGAVRKQGGYLVPEWLPATALALRVVAALDSPAGRLRHPARGRYEPAGTGQRSLARGGARSSYTAGGRAAAGRGLTSGSVEDLQWQVLGLHGRHPALVEIRSSPV